MSTGTNAEPETSGFGRRPPKRQSGHRSRVGAERPQSVGTRSTMTRPGPVLARDSRAASTKGAVTILTAPSSPRSRGPGSRADDRGRGKPITRQVWRLSRRQGSRPPGSRADDRLRRQSTRSVAVSLASPPALQEPSTARALATAFAGRAGARRRARLAAGVIPTCELSGLGRNRFRFSLHIAV
jgi:hypothetical protein